MEIKYNQSQIEKFQKKLAEQISAHIADKSAAALVGVRSRGEILAQRLQRTLQESLGQEIELGTLDITLYRDDLNKMGSNQPALRPTEIDFSIDDKLIILIDDVLSTGRSVRAALDALLYIGRPRAVRLAVLLDRGGRELPISADFIGKKLNVPDNKVLQVYLDEVDGREEVTLE